MEHNQAVIYKGPFKKVLDDDGHAMERGKRYAVCDKTYRLCQQEPYRGHFYAVPPLKAVTNPQPFTCTATRERHPRETKGLDCDATTDARVCTAGADCC